MTKEDANAGHQDSVARKTPLGIERHFDRFGDWLDTSWALQKAAPLFERHPLLVIVVTWLMRLAVGATFCISGLAKGIDPWGTFYKMSEYLEALHLPFAEWPNVVLTLSFVLFSLEFLIGVCLMTGCFRKAAPILAALVMIVMLPLTLWIAVADPVADCGCFGDFLVISNWATFFKNVVLAIAVVWLVRFNREAICLITPSVQWLAFIAAAAYILLVGHIGYRQQPMIDFRQYKVGTQLFASEEKPEFIPTFTFVYEKDGIEKSFGEEDELPDETDGWKFVRREENEFMSSGNEGQQGKAPVADFRIWNEDASEDVTELLASDDPQLILFSPDISELSMAASWKINSIYDIASENGVEFFAVASGRPDDIERWRDLSSGQYPIYTAEDTSIKELVRGNPGLVSLSNGRIMWKSALSAIVLDDTPAILSDGDENQVDSPVASTVATYPVGTAMSGPDAFLAITLILVGLLAILMLGSGLWRAISHVAPSSRRRCEEE